MERELATAVSDVDCTKNKTPVRIGLVGCGRVAEHGYLPAFRRVQGATLVGVSDMNPSRCRALAPTIPFYEDIQSLIRAGGIDALVISVPTRFHLDYARRAAEAGVPSLVEKPPGVDLQEAKALGALKPCPWIAFNRRFEPSLVRLKRAVPNHSKWALRLELHYRRTTWKPFDMHDDALLDLGPHLIDLARWLTENEICSTRTISLDQQYAEFELELTQGRAAVCCSTNRPYRERMDIIDSNGRLLASYRRGGVVSGIIARLRPKVENPLITSLVGQIEAFAETVRGGPSRSLASVDDGLAVMSVIEAIRRSARERGAPVFITE